RWSVVKVRDDGQKGPAATLLRSVANPSNTGQPLEQGRADMGFAVEGRVVPDVVEHDPNVVVLHDGSGGVAEVWPGLGFNCFRWSAGRDGKTYGVLYADPSLFGQGRP